MNYNHTYNHTELLSIIYNVCCIDVMMRFMTELRFSGKI